jgi:hypothetical protein
MSGVQTLCILFSPQLKLFACVCVCVFEQLVEVNSEAVNNKSVEEITRLLKGLPNSPVQLTLSPPNQ